MLQEYTDNQLTDNFYVKDSTYPGTLTFEDYESALKASKTLGLKVAGVDIIRSKKGPLLLEVNSSPGLEGIESATGKDIAGMMISSIEKKLGWKRELNVESES